MKKIFLKFLQKIIYEIFINYKLNIQNIYTNIAEYNM